MAALPTSPATPEPRNCADVGSTALYSSLANLALTGRAAGEHLPATDDYRAVVCLFLDGGNDSFNLLVPLEPDEYARYQSARGDLALDRGALHPITDPVTGRRFGVHPGMPAIRDLYAAGQLSFVCNVGTLIEPTDLAGVTRATARLPLGLYSHADQVMHWQTSTPDTRGSTGWAGRAAEILQTLNEKDSVSMNISMSGTNIFQSGKNLVPYSITPDGVSLLRGYADPSLGFFRKAVDSMLELQYQNLLKRTYARFTRSAIESADRFLAAWNSAPPVTTTFPNTVVGRNLQGVARCIAARKPLGQRRQTFFVRAGGWDHHDEVLETQGRMLPTISEAVGAFWSAITELGLDREVVLFTTSDFGRTLSSNGRGSDHGWGGNQFVLGGGHRGGRLAGRYPENLALGNDLDTGRGRLIPTTSVDTYFAELALWLGVQRGDLDRVLPNLRRFHDPHAAATPLGLFGGSS